MEWLKIGKCQHLKSIGGFKKFDFDISESKEDLRKELMSIDKQLSPFLVEKISLSSKTSSNESLREPWTLSDSLEFQKGENPPEPKEKTNILPRQIPKIFRKTSSETETIFSFDIEPDNPSLQGEPILENSSAGSSECELRTLNIIDEDRFLSVSPILPSSSYVTTVAALNGIHIAAAKGYDKLLEKMIAKDFDVECRSDYLQNSPLHYACMNGKINCVKVLIKQECSLEAINSHYDNCLHICIESSVFESISIFEMIFNILETKCELSTDLRKTLLDSIIRLDRPNFLESFLNLSKNDLNCISNGWSMVHESCYGGSINCLKYLYNLNHDLNVSYTNLNMGFSNVKPVHLAIFNGHLDIVRFLVSHINIEYNECVTVMGANYSTLMTAVFNEYIDIFDEIIDKCDVNVKNDQGDTALHFASLRGNGKLIMELLKRNADVNVQNKLGITPIWNALNYPEIVDILINYGAKTDIFLNECDTKAFGVELIKKSLLEKALECGNSGTVQLLLNSYKSSENSQSAQSQIVPSLKGMCQEIVDKCEL
ncbi:DgyrCDS10179 [Dimorphilus gyrociliatus]|uniref:DgyrCDS10179 n=1 Tax=Dimorphilus gyrociliatus TaxID=2664684 RepID=A0A7I8W4I0_9ANNE|nr:DgyrCDS10179 [Dimorphilus gyrociliatus]